jgi:hypothetical protein
MYCGGRNHKLLQVRKKFLLFKNMMRHLFRRVIFASGEYNGDEVAHFANELKSELSRLQSEFDDVERSVEGPKSTASTSNQHCDRTLMMFIGAGRRFVMLPDLR